jgi:8-oxo-dGTP pyrophosphatase MutT (NUDIX family)
MTKREYGALPYFIKNKRIRIVLVTTRRGQKWICPKGQPETGLSGADVATQEAFEEAGVAGIIDGDVRGRFDRRRRGERVTTRLYPLRVNKIHKRWPEQRQRQRAVVSLSKALSMITDKRLRDCVKELAEVIRAQTIKA